MKKSKVGAAKRTAKTKTHPSVLKLCAQLAERIARDGTMPVTVTLNLWPVEIMLLARAARIRGTSIEQVINDHVCGDLPRAVALCDTLNDYEGEIPQPKGAKP